MTKGEALRALRAVLVGLYQDRDSIRRVVDDAGVNTAQINFQGAPADIWHSVLLEADKSGRIGSIVQTATDEYPNHAGRLAQAHQAYGEAADPPAGAGQAQPGAPASGGTINTGGGAYIGGNLTIGSGDFVGRDKIVGAPAGGSGAGQTTDVRRAALQSELQQHERNLTRLQAQKAVYALGEEPLRLLNQIEHEEQEIERIQRELARLAAS